MTLNKADLKRTRIAEHLYNLKQMGYIPANLKPIQKLERKMHKFAEDDCNGLINDEQKSFKFAQNIIKEVNKLFKTPLKDLYINTDPRGYALKIDDMNNGTTKLYRDMGGYGILSPNF